MKKLFIGCGIVVLLVAGGLFYLGYQVYPQMKEWQTQWVAAFDRLQALEHAHPFDTQAQSELPLDGQRFEASLELRATLADDLAAVGERLEALNVEGPDGKSRGTVEIMRAMFATATDVLPNYAGRLEEAQMSWPEFAWHTRLLWACLIRVDAGVGPPELEPLRGSYDNFTKAYEKIRQQNGNDMPKLPELIGTFPLPLVSAASTILAQDLGRVQHGLHFIAVDHLYMQPISRFEDMKGLQVAQEDLARRMAEKEAAGDGTSGGSGVTEPAGAPVPLGKDAPGGAPPANGAGTVPPKTGTPAEPDKPGGK